VVAAADEVVRQLAATVASNEFRAHPDRPSPRRIQVEVPGRLVCLYAAEVDPRGVLVAAERAKRIRAAYRRDMALRALEERRTQLAGAGGGHDDRDAA
jgi:hypothetical protein